MPFIKANNLSKFVDHYNKNLSIWEGGICYVYFLKLCNKLPTAATGTFTYPLGHSVSVEDNLPI